MKRTYTPHFLVRHLTMALLGMVVATSSLLLTGCGGRRGDTPAEKPVVTVQCLNTTEDYLLAIERMCPDVEIRWWPSRQFHHNLYDYLDTIPDILIASAYSFNDSLSRNHLRDISEKGVASRYNRSVYDNFRQSDGSVYWIPVLGFAQVLATNPELFDRYGIALPTDMQSLIAADAAFKRHGVDGIAWGLGHQWSYDAMLVAQIIGADLFNSVECMRWKQEYRENGRGADGYVMDDVMWPEVFSRFRQAIDCGLIDDDDLQIGTYTAADNFRQGKSAMVLGSTDLAFLKSDYPFLPVYDMQGTAWVPIYLQLALGVSKNVTDEHLPDVIKVVDAMLSAPAYDAYNSSRGGLVPLNDDTSLLEERALALKEPVSGGYSFLLTNDENYAFKEALSATVHRMKTDGLTPAQAYVLCDSLTREGRVINEENGINHDDPEHSIYYSNAYYPLVCGPDHNSPANASAAQTILASVNTLAEQPYDILLTQGSTVGVPLLRGHYCLNKDGRDDYSSYLHYLFNYSFGYYQATMTVGELKQYMNTTFYWFNRVVDCLPVMAGAEYEVLFYDQGLPEEQLPFTPNNANAGSIANVQKCPVRFVCGNILRDGQPLPDDQTVRVLVSRPLMFYITTQDMSLPSTWLGFDNFGLTTAEGKAMRSNKDFFLDWLKTGHDILPPQRYVTLIDASAPTADSNRVQPDKTKSE